MNTSTNIKTFLDWIEDTQALSVQVTGDLKEKNENIQDIMHYLEFNDAPYKERKALTDLLPQLRRERRIAKDTEDVIAPIMTWINDNKRAIRELQNTLGSIRKREQAQTNRAYFYRTDIVKKTIGHE